MKPKASQNSYHGSDLRDFLAGEGDPSTPSLTVASLGKAAAALGRKVELRFVPA
jgi:hypothetical protein